MTVNITCSACDGRRLCDACAAAAALLERSGFHVEHSTRYAALKAASTGSYGFDACIVPVGAEERGVVDAALALLGGKRLAFVAEGGGVDAAGLGGRASIIDARAYSDGAFPLDWLTRRVPAEASPLPVEEPVPHLVEPAIVDQRAADELHATRRLKRVADAARTVVATAGLPKPPRLDLVAVLEDEIAWARAGGTSFSIVLVHLHGISAQRSAEEPARADERVQAAQRAIATAVRSTDVIAGNIDDFLVVLAEAPHDGAALACTRIVDAIRAADLRPAGKSKRARGLRAWSIGVATFPGDGTTRDTLLARATATLKDL